MGRINQLAEKTTLNSTDVIAVDAGAGGNTNKMTGANLAEQLKALGDYQDKLTFDTTPTAGSTNPVTSGGVKTALNGKQNTLTFDSTPTAGSNNPVTSGGIANAIAQSTATLNTIEDHQVTKIGNYITERANFKARRVGGTVIILSYVQVTTQVPATTQFADIGISNAEGIFAFVSGGTSHIVSCSSGKLQPDAVLPTGYYYVIGSALAPHT